MKRIFGLSLCLFTVFLLGACSSDDTPVANVPQLSGNITFDRTRVGVGQPVKMSFALPAQTIPRCAFIRQSFSSFFASIVFSKLRALSGVAICTFKTCLRVYIESEVSSAFASAVMHINSMLILSKHERAYLILCDN